MLLDKSMKTIIMPCVRQPHKACLCFSNGYAFSRIGPWTARTLDVHPLGCVQRLAVRLYYSCYRPFSPWFRWSVSWVLAAQRLVKMIVSKSRCNDKELQFQFGRTARPAVLHGSVLGVRSEACSLTIFRPVGAAILALRHIQITNRVKFTYCTHKGGCCT